MGYPTEDIVSVNSDLCNAWLVGLKIGFTFD